MTSIQIAMCYIANDLPHYVPYGSNYLGTRPCSVCGMGGCFPVNRHWPFPRIAGPKFPSTCPRCGRFNSMPF